MSTVGFVLDPASVDETQAYIAEMQESILRAIRSGMSEAMDTLAAAAVSQMSEAGIQNRTGDLFRAIMESPRVTETAQAIRGTVSSDVGKKHVGLWLEEGTHVPAVEGHLYEFSEPDASSVFTHGHAAFNVTPHPFLNPALEREETIIIQTIQDAVEGALAQ